MGRFSDVEAVRCGPIGWIRSAINGLKIGPPEVIDGTPGG